MNDRRNVLRFPAVVDDQDLGDDDMPESSPAGFTKEQMAEMAREIGRAAFGIEYDPVTGLPKG